MIADYSITGIIGFRNYRGDDCFDFIGRICKYHSISHM